MKDIRHELNSEWWLDLDVAANEFLVEAVDAAQTEASSFRVLNQGKRLRQGQTARPKE